MEVERWADATDELRAVLRAQPDDVEALCLLASCHERAGDPRGMLDAADRALRVRPQNEWALRLRAHALLKLKRRRAATAAAQAAVASAPYLWQTHATLAEVLARRGGTRWVVRARRAADTVLRMAPELAAAHILDSVVHLEMGDVRAARLACERALAIDPGNQVALHNLAVTDLARNRVAAAARGFTAALSIAPNDPVTGAAHTGSAIGVLWRLFDGLALVTLTHVVVFWATADLLGPLRRPVALATAGAVLTGFGWLWRRTWLAQPAAVRWRLRSQARHRAVVLNAVLVLAAALGLVISAYGPPMDSGADQLRWFLLRLTVVALLGRASMRAYERTTRAVHRLGNRFGLAVHRVRLRLQQWRG